MNKLKYSEVSNFTHGSFIINEYLEVFFKDEQIGSIEIIEGHNNDDFIACFLPGHVSFQHRPVSDVLNACKLLYTVYGNYVNKCGQWRSK
jgi:hypothetical protein